MRAPGTTCAGAPPLGDRRGPRAKARGVQVGTTLWSVYQRPTTRLAFDGFHSLGRDRVVIGRTDRCLPSRCHALGRAVHRPDHLSASTRGSARKYARQRTGRGKYLVSASAPRHNSYMPEQPTADDLEKAHLILSEFGLLVGPAGAMSDVIARAVAAGIAVGRKEALAKTRRSKSSESSAS